MKRRGSLAFHFYQQWKELTHIRQYNWANFTFIQLEFEYAPYKYSWEIRFGLLGFNLTIEHYRPHD